MDKIKCYYKNQMFLSNIWYRSINQLSQVFNLTNLSILFVFSFIKFIYTINDTLVYLSIILMLLTREKKLKWKQNFFYCHRSLTYLHHTFSAYVFFSYFHPWMGFQKYLYGQTIRMYAQYVNTIITKNIPCW